MPGPKLNNRRKYPDANHQPMHLAALRKKDALERQAAYDKLTLDEKIAKLPPEPHAKQQRARLLAALEKQNAPKPPPKNDAPKPEAAEATKEQPKQKKYMKGSK